MGNGRHRDAGYERYPDAGNEGYPDAGDEGYPDAGYEGYRIHRLMTEVEIREEETRRSNWPYDGTGESRSIASIARNAPKRHAGQKCYATYIPRVCSQAQTLSQSQAP